MHTQLMGLYAETQIHAGAGSAIGVIDLPIMRESHTGWPCVFGSAVKGALRAHAEKHWHSPVGKDTLVELFGPDTDNASDHAGALIVGDARLLLLPVRSLTTHFKWVTCPALLQRAAADARRMGSEAPDLSALPPLSDKQALVSGTEQKSLYLEEFQFDTQQHDLEEIVNWLSQYVGHSNFKNRLSKQLVIINDDLFAHLSEFGTPVTPHIAIENKNKTVKQGALWYEETLPPETVLYLPLACNHSRKKDSQLDGVHLLQQAIGLFPENQPYLQLGGNETVGMGWCYVKALNKGDK